jgi:probable rRNA maturation factor
MVLKRPHSGIAGKEPGDRKLLIESTVTEEGWTALLPDLEAWARPILRETLIGAGARERLAAGCALSLLLAGDAEIQDLNLRFRGKDKPTNVLSFPAHPNIAEPGALGDIAFALQTIRAEAGARGKPVIDHATHLLVHGILHLLGFTHDADDEAERMMAIEVAVLGKLGLPDPYAEPMQAGAA